MAATEDQIRDLASTIAAQAQALADGTVTGPRYAAVLRLNNNVDTLAAWVGDDRNDYRAEDRVCGRTHKSVTGTVTEGGKWVHVDWDDPAAPYESVVWHEDIRLIPHSATDHTSRPKQRPA